MTDRAVLWNPEPDLTDDGVDAFGNEWFKATWSNPTEEISSVVEVTCRDEMRFAPIVTWDNRRSDSKYRYPEDVRQWLEPDNLGFIQSDAPEIVELAETLSTGAMLQIDVVGRVLAWVHENVLVAACDEPVDGVDALWTLENRVGICVNFANLSIALLRAAGIPAIAVSGVVADSESPDVGHAWISVYFTDLGWFEFESSPGLPAYGAVAETILMPQHITRQVGDAYGISNVRFNETHSCRLTIEQRPKELGFVRAEIAPDEAVSWILSVRSPSFYEIYEWEYGYADLSVSLSLEGVPDGWYASLSSSEVRIPSQATGSSPTRSVVLSIRPAIGATLGEQNLITVTARDTGSVAQPVIGIVTASVTVVESP